MSRDKRRTTSTKRTNGAKLKPYYERGGITLYHGDCAAVLARLGNRRIDITLTSPPYNQLSGNSYGSGMHGESGWCANVRELGYADERPEREYQGWLAGIVERCLFLSRGLVWVNHKLRFRARRGIHPVRFLPFALHQEIIWSRDGSIQLNNRRFALSHEALYAFGAPHYWHQPSTSQLTVWSIPHTRERNGHPCPFPVELAARVIVASCPPGGVVLDPFAGVATTAIAALESGRRAILIESEKRFCRAAAQRIDAALDAKAQPARAA